MTLFWTFLAINTVIFVVVLYNRLNINYPMSTPYIRLFILSILGGREDAKRLKDRIRFIQRSAFAKEPEPGIIGRDVDYILKQEVNKLNFPQNSFSDIYYNDSQQIDNSLTRADLYRKISIKYFDGGAVPSVVNYYYLDTTNKKGEFVLQQNTVNMINLRHWSNDEIEEAYCYYAKSMNTSDSRLHHYFKMKGIV